MSFIATNNVATRPAPPTHQEWIPLPYMERASLFLQGHYVAGLPLKPGGRKTSITLDAFTKLQAAGKARTMLVIAPLRVCRQVWRQEAKKWSQFRHLQFALLHGRKKTEALKSGADVYLINPEGIAWLAKQYMGRSLPFDVVAIDELTKFQNAQATRHKELRPRLSRVKYRWGLTGSFFAKGHMGIFGQQLILDDGAALGRYITHYRDKYFQVGYDGFSYDLLPGAEKRIVEKLAPYWFYVTEADYSELPEIVDVPHKAKMDRAQRTLYDKMKRDMILNLPDGEVTAANAGACYSKLAQMANGAVYLDDHRVSIIHDLKIEMIEELVDELNGEPLLVGYEFNHDLERLRAWYKRRYGADAVMSYIGKGTTATQEDQWVAQWNRGEIPFMPMHPQSGGHGLNMQEGQARNVAWFSATWDWELYDQFIRRVRRSGNENKQVFNHILIVEDTIDDEKLAAILEKDLTEGRLTASLRNEILRESQDQPETGENTMVAKLSRPGDGQAPQQQTAPANGGWGAQQPATQQPAQEQPVQQQAPANGGWGGQPQPDQSQQRQQIQEQIAPQPDRAAAAAAAFSGNVADGVANIAGADYGATGPADRPAQPAGGWGAQPSNGNPTQPAQAQQPSNDAPFEGGQPEQPRTQPATEPDKALSKMKKDELIEYAQSLQSQRGGGDNPQSALYNARAAVVVGTMQSMDDNATVEDIVDIARELMDFVERG